MQDDFTPVQQSRLAWLFDALGVQYTVLLLLAGLVGFLIALVVVLRGRGPLASAALLLAVSLPLLVGVFGAFDGAMASVFVIAQSTVAPRPSEIAEGVSTALATPLVGMWLMLPTLLLAVFGSLVRALVDRPAK